MLIAPLLSLLLFAAAPSPPASVIPGVPVPPEGTFEAELTKVATDRAAAEMKAGLASLEKDRSVPEAQKKEIKRKIARLKIAIYTTPKTLEETAFYYERELHRGNFIFAERDILSDLREIARLGGLTLDPNAESAWSGQRGHSGRWSRDDGELEIDIEDHLIDPRDGKVTKRTVVMITSVAGG